MNGFGFSDDPGGGEVRLPVGPPAANGAVERRPYEPPKRTDDDFRFGGVLFSGDHMDNLRRLAEGNLPEYTASTYHRFYAGVLDADPTVLHFMQAAAYEAGNTEAVEILGGQLDAIVT